MNSLSSKAPPSPVCKICKGRTRPFADIQANRTCEDERRPVFPPSPRTVAYHRCTSCGFMFSSDFDSLTDAELGAEIYNDDYLLADPGAAGRRPRYQATHYAAILDRVSLPIRGLDYGGGNGLFARLMTEHGVDFTSYDPYFGDPTPPRERYNLITCFEVFEHSRDPVGTLADLLRYLEPCGTVLFTTAIQPRRVTANWHYIAPRNGHVSIHSATSLQRLARDADTSLLSLHDQVHLLYRREQPALAKALMNAWPLDEALYNASMRGPAHLVRVAAILRSLGINPGAGMPRHLVRSALHILPGAAA